MADLTSQAQALGRDNEQLLKQNERLLAERRNIDQTIERKVQQKIQSQEGKLQAKARESQGVLSSLTRRVDELSSVVEHYTPGEPQSDLPAELGYDQAPSGVLIWHEPLDAPGTDPATGRPGLLKTTALEEPAREQRKHEPGTKAKAALKPVYTVPENATLIGSTAFTALVGRIPLRGRVQDPWPFKAITGAANLTANGLKLPEVAGMVWSGTAVGDWTLGCVRGWVTSVTFVFRDGTIRTVASNKNQSARGLINDGVVSDNALGWISDKWGTPCLSGQRITNAPEFLTQRVALLAAQAAAEAAASAQTTTITGAANGTVTQSVDDSTQFIIGKTVSGGVDEINKWLLERQQQSFDAVFVRAGAQVAINVTKEITVDYDPLGRKLRYVNEKGLHGAGRRVRLD